MKPTDMLLTGIGIIGAAGLYLWWKSENEGSIDLVLNAGYLGDDFPDVPVETEWGVDRCGGSFRISAEHALDWGYDTSTELLIRYEVDGRPYCLRDRIMAGDHSFSVLVTEADGGPLWGEEGYLRIEHAVRVGAGTLSKFRWRYLIDGSFQPPVEEALNGSEPATSETDPPAPPPPVVVTVTGVTVPSFLTMVLGVGVRLYVDGRGVTTPFSLQPGTTYNLKLQITTTILGAVRITHEGTGTLVVPMTETTLRRTLDYDPYFEPKFELM